MNGRERSGPGLYTIGIAALFLAGFLLLMIFGAGSYRDAVGSQNANNDRRILQSYIGTLIRANDQSGAVSIRTYGEQPILVIADPNTGYAFRIYQHDGTLVEDFAETDAELDPESAEIIGETEAFDVTVDENGVLVVTTDAGRSVVTIRSDGGVQDEE